MISVSPERFAEFLKACPWLAQDGDRWLDGTIERARRRTDRYGAIYEIDACPECASFEVRGVKDVVCGIDTSYSVCDECGHRWDIG